MWVAQNYGLEDRGLGSDLPVYNTATRVARMGRIVGVVGNRAQVNVGGSVVYVRVSDEHVTMIAGAL